MRKYRLFAVAVALAAPVVIGVGTAHASPSITSCDLANSATPDSNQWSYVAPDSNQWGGVGPDSNQWEGVVPNGNQRPRAAGEQWP